MTTPTGQIAMSDIRLEIYGSATGSIDLEDANVRTLAGIPSGAISMSDCKGKTWGGGSTPFTPTGGEVSQQKTYPNAASVTITCTTAATWSYVNTVSDTGTAVSVANNGSSTSISFSLQPSQFSDHSASWTLTGVNGSHTANFNVDLTTIGLE